MRSLWLGLQRKLASDVLTILPRWRCWMFPKVAEWQEREKKTPNLGRESRGRSPLMHCLCLAVFCLAMKEWDIFMPCKRMLLTLTHHLQGTSQSQTKSNQRLRAPCVSSVGKQMQKILVDNYGRIYPQRKEDIKLILWWLFFTLKHSAAYPFYWEEHTAIIYSKIAPELLYHKLNYYREYSCKHVCHSLFGHDAVAMIILSSLTAHDKLILQSHSYFLNHHSKL